jgi:hypothetical protein
MSMPREEIETLLPFLANGTLEGDELAEVQNAVVSDAGLAADLAALSAIRETMQSDDVGFSPGEMGLARLMRDVEAEAKAAPVDATSNVMRPRIWQIAAALLLAVALGQGVLLMERNEAGPGFELAGETTATFTIAVRPEATEAELRSVLLAAGVEIVSGPSALGLYGLALLEGSDVATARGTLEAAGDVIETLESAE